MLSKLKNLLQELSGSSIPRQFQNLDDLPFSTFQIACYRLQKDVITLFLEKDRTLCDKKDEKLGGVTPIIMCSIGYKKLMRKIDLIQPEFPTHNVKRDLKLLYQSAIELLIKAGADLNQKTSYGSIARWAISSCDFETFEFLVRHGVDLKVQGEDSKSLIYSIASSGLDLDFSKNMIEILLKSGVNIDSKKKNGETALFAAIRRENVELVDFLLSKGASHNIISEKRETPLHFAASRKNCTIEMLSCLIKAGADVNAVSERENSNVLMHALMLKRGKEILSFLIKQGAKTDLKVFKQATCLDVAVAQKMDEEIVDLLLDSGVNPYENGIGGLNAFDIAENEGVTYKRFEELKKEKLESDGSVPQCAKNGGVKKEQVDVKE